MNDDVAFDSIGAWPGVLERVLSGESLSADEAECVLDEVLTANATHSQIAALLVALRAKGESAQEMVGMVRSMMNYAERLTIGGDVLDVVGTGGDRLGSINVSTLAAIVAAGAGARVCKHGNRAASSSVGTADVLEALGVVVDLEGEGVGRCVQEAGMGFCFAPRFHPAMRHAAPVRKEIGIPTVFNFLGPLANPARARFQLVGVSAPHMAETMAGVLGANGTKRAMVVYADDGLDELSVTSRSTVIEVIGGETGEFELKRWELDPADLGFDRSKLEELRGGDAEFNANAIKRVLDGQRGACRDIGILNAGAALVVAGLADDVAEGVARASASVDDGSAKRVLEELVRVSNDVSP